MLSCLHQAPHAVDGLGEACIPHGPEGAGPRLHGHWGRQGPPYFRLLVGGPVVASFLRTGGRRRSASKGGTS